MNRFARFLTTAVAALAAVAVSACGDSKPGADVETIVLPEDIWGNNDGHIPVDLVGRDLNGLDLAQFQDTVVEVPIMDTVDHTDHMAGDGYTLDANHPTDDGDVDIPTYDWGHFDNSIPGDRGWGDATPGGCSPCGYGSISGYTCIRGTNKNMPFVKVWIDTVDCDGNPLHLETHSDAQGFFILDGVPCGTQTINMAKGSYSNMISRWIDKAMVTEITTKDGCIPPPLRVAVITGKWDRIENVLRALWFHFKKFDGMMDNQDAAMPQGAALLGGLQAKDLLGDKFTLIDDFDVLFINCGDSPDWITAENGPAIYQTLRAFVKKGGSIYASDYASPYLYNSWPAAWEGSFPHDFPGSTGKPRPVTAQILDPELAGYLAKDNAIVSFGLGPLTSIVGSAPAGTTVHLQGPNEGHGNAVEPFMISYKPEGIDGGRVVFTNFHNDEQAAGSPTDMAEILQFVVFLL